MVAQAADGEDLVYGKRYSSVVPAKVTGENVVRELTGMDLVMKLHYLRGVYLFNSDAVRGLNIYSLKEPMFKWLELYYAASGRIRRAESGRPFIKCNDGGVRIVEAQCDKTIDELLLEMGHLHSRLVPSQVLGPDLHFSPLVHIQFTWFKCGGISVGLSWAHVLGDAFSSSKFINMWARILAGNPPKKPLISLHDSPCNLGGSKTEPPSIFDPLAVKPVGPVGDHWVTPNSCKLRTFTLQITTTQLNQLLSKLSTQNAQIPPFEALASVIWQCLARIREGSSEPRLVTICRSNSLGGENGVLRNNQIISVVKAEFPVVEAQTMQLTEMLVKDSVDKSRLIEEVAEKDQGLNDFTVYGVNLTFVDLEEVELYGLELNGHKPVFASYIIDGIGDKGVVLVLPKPESDVEKGSGGRIVTVILPENEVLELKTELKKRWCIG